MAIKKRRRGAVVLISILAWGVFFAGRVSAQDTAVDQAFERATQQHQNGDLQGAIRAYSAILEKYPARVDVRSNLGAAFSALGRYEEAIDQYKRALVIDSDNLAIRFNLALAYYKAAWFADAVPELEKFIAAAPNSPQSINARLVLADCQVRLGEYKRVIQLLSPLAEADPENRTLAYLLGSALIGDGQLDKGQAIIDRLFRHEDSSEAHLLMASILLLADDAQAALKEAQRAIELNAKLPAVQAWYGRVLMRLGDTEKAKTAFKNELASNPNDFESHLYLGVLLRQDKQLDEALAHLQRAIQLRPREQYARYHLAAVYAAAGKPGDALPLLEGVLKEHGDFVEARVLLASVYYRLNRKEDGDREKALIQKANTEQQAKPPNP
ncbi:MAG TPA: tetratricopeptide repeat protein [Pyrinomonadaceae bacterium]|jgi:tetratricopeptide (TPR) repeat protein|nr:tetratricopeptide repeat protein [Pyrinomonadaceae bacterium]